MRFMLQTAGYTKRDQNESVQMLQELYISSDLDHISRYHQNWKEHIMRMDLYWFPKPIMKFCPNGLYSLGLHMKR